MLYIYLSIYNIDLKWPIDSWKHIHKWIRYNNIFFSFLLSFSLSISSIVIPITEHTHTHARTHLRACPRARAYARTRNLPWMCVVWIVEIYTFSSLFDEIVCIWVNAYKRKIDHCADFGNQLKFMLWSFAPTVQMKNERTKNDSKNKKRKWEIERVKKKKHRTNDQKCE